MKSEQSHSIMFILLTVNTTGIGWLMLQTNVVAGSALCFLSLLSAIYFEVKHRQNNSIDKEGD